MLPCVCSVIDHKWCQNVVRTEKLHRRRSCVWHWCSHNILTSSVIYYWTDTWKHGIYLFYTIKNINIPKKAFLFQISPLWQSQKHDLLSFQNKANWLVAMLSKELWLVQKSRNCQIWIECCRHLCVCPLIDHSREPIKMRAELSLLYNIR